MKNVEKKELGCYIIKQIKILRPDLSLKDLQKVICHLYYELRRQNKNV